MDKNFFIFHNPVKIISGYKAVNNIPEELSLLGVKRPMIITDKGVVEAGILKKVEKSFRESNITIGAVFDNVPQDSSKYTVKEAAEIYRKKICDSLIALGGGSVIDTSKGVNIILTENVDNLFELAGAERLKKDMKPFIVVPTTHGTGSESTLVAVISDPDENAKLPFTSYKLLPDVAILDPNMTVTLPPKLSAATSMDALTHAIEAYISLQKNPVSDSFAISAIKLISENILEVLKNKRNKKARLKLLNASCMAGAAFSNAMVGVVHTLGHAIGGVCHIPHGVAMNIFLTHGLEYNKSIVGKYIGELLYYVEGIEVFRNTPKDKRADRFIAYINSLKNRLYEITGLPRTLKEAGVTKNNFERIAEIALGDGSQITNAKEIEHKDIMEILIKAYK